jgi:hypothetical protein
MAATPRQTADDADRNRKRYYVIISRWFRVYDELLDDPKVQQLSPKNFRGLINLWCVASRNDGVLPPEDDLAFKLRMKPSEIASLISALRAAGLIDQADKGLTPHNWSTRQYKSDTSNERVKRYRERQRNAECNVTPDVTDDVTVTPPDTDTDTDSSLRETHAASANDHGFTDVVYELWNDGPAILISLGVDDRKARQMIGRWLKDAKNDHAQVLSAIKRARDARTGDPIPFVTAAIRTGGPGDARTTKTDPMMVGLKRRFVHNFGNDLGVAP